MKLRVEYNITLAILRGCYRLEAVAKLWCLLATPCEDARCSEAAASCVLLTL